MRFLTAALVVFATGCMGVLGQDGVGGGTGGSGNAGTGGGSGGGGGGGSVVPTNSGLPCDVAALISAKCASCHGASPSGGVTLLTRAEFMAPSARDAAQSYGQRAVARMNDMTSPMPPGNPLSAADIAVFSTWVSGGMLEGNCGAIDAGSSEPTCASNSFKTAPSSTSAHDGFDMAPGWACISCHSGANFAGQNPYGWSAGGELYTYMGTVFSAPHEKDMCKPTLTAPVRVEIYDGTTRALVVSMPVDTTRGNGNFYGDAARIPATYTAKVITANGTREMLGAQSNRDCNTCHTVAGANSAPGRIYVP